MKTEIVGIAQTNWGSWTVIDTLCESPAQADEVEQRTKAQAQRTCEVEFLQRINPTTIRHRYYSSIGD
jgi:hypothetical protein